MIIQVSWENEKKQINKTANNNRRHRCKTWEKKLFYQHPTRQNKCSLKKKKKSICNNDLKDKERMLRDF